jgi:predicted SnoaL-like aldol condensation-catalyzing enzyme
MKPAPGALSWNTDAPPFDPRDTSNRERLSVREVAERFIQLFYAEDNPADGFMCWMHPDYIQHNPNAPSGRDATLEVLAAAVRNNPDLTHEVKRVIHGEVKDSEGLVVVHHHFRRKQGERGWAVVDILRIKHGYVVEHWDVMQEVPDPADTKNDNGMF